MAALGFALFLLVFGQAAVGSPTWSVVLNPPTAHATGVDWQLSLSSPYCGGYRIGEGVFLQPDAAFAFPDPLPPDSVLFAGGPADVSQADGVLRIAPTPDRLWSQVCIQGERPFTIELLPSLGLSNPDARNYGIDVWIDSGPDVTLQVSVVDQ